MWIIYLQLRTRCLTTQLITLALVLNKVDSCSRRCSKSKRFTHLINPSYFLLCISKTNTKLFFNNLTTMSLNSQRLGILLMTQANISLEFKQSMKYTRILLKMIKLTYYYFHNNTHMDCFDLKLKGNALYLKNKGK